MERNIVKKIAKKAAEGMMSSIPYEWPPSCILFTYQPARPTQKIAQAENAGTSETREDQ